MTMLDERIFVDSDVVIEWFVTPASGVVPVGDVTLEIKQPLVASVFGDVTSPADNQFRCIFNAAVVGRHRIFWKAAGTINHAKADHFMVEPKGF